MDTCKDTEALVREIKRLREERLGILRTLKGVREEITRINQAAGETVFNPAVKDAVAEEVRSIADIEWNPYTQEWQKDEVDHYHPNQSFTWVAMQDQERQRRDGKVTGILHPRKCKCGEEATRRIVRTKHEGRSLALSDSPVYCYVCGVRRMFDLEREESHVVPSGAEAKRGSPWRISHPEWPGV
jgi:hypothetical protein